MSNKEKEMSRKDRIYNSTKNLVGLEQSTMTTKNNEIRGGSINMGLPTDAVTTELVRQAKVVVNNRDAVNSSVQTDYADGIAYAINSHTLVVGVGQGGGNSAQLATAEGFVTMAVNTALEDTTNLDVNHVFIIKDAYGSGKERLRAKQKFVNDKVRFLESYNKIVSNKTTVIIVHTATGGTGSGIAPMLANVTKDNYPDKNVFLFTFIGDIKEDIKNQENAVAVIEEFEKAGVNYLVFDNGKAKGSSLEEVYNKVNHDALDAMKAISKQYFVESERQNMDGADMQKLYMENRRMVIVSGNFDRKVSGSCDYEQQMIDTINKSTIIGTCGSSVTSYGFFINVEESMYSELDEHFRAFEEALGEPYEQYRHLQTRETSEGPDFTIFISGLDPIVDRFILINKRIAEFNSRRVIKRSILDVEKVTIVGRDNTPAIIVPAEAPVNNDSRVIDTSGFDNFM